MYDVTSIGELLVDFTPQGKGDNGYNIFVANPGGAPANVLACLSKLQFKTAFIGKVGDDNFGKFLKTVLQGLNINTDGLVLDKKVETTLAFVHLEQDGNRSFSFSRANGADKAITTDDIRFDIIDNSRIVHFGSVSLTDEPSRTATLQAIRYAKSANKVISFDPNWRESLWSDKELGIKLIEQGIAMADIVKLSEEELWLVTNTRNNEEAIDYIINKNPNLSILLVTLGAYGCFFANRIERTFIKSITMHNGKPLKVIDTTGAGDCFLGAFLSRVLLSDGNDINTIKKAAIFANRAAAVCITKKGGIPSMPTLEEINAL